MSKAPEHYKYAWMGTQCVFFSAIHPLSCSGEGSAKMNGGVIQDAILSERCDREVRYLEVLVILGSGI
jgi:hypothetical protein